MLFKEVSFLFLGMINEQDWSEISANRIVTKKENNTNLIILKQN